MLAFDSRSREREREELERKVASDSLLGFDVLLVVRWTVKSHS